MFSVKDHKSWKTFKWKTLLTVMMHRVDIPLVSFSQYLFILSLKVHECWIERARVNEAFCGLSSQRRRALYKNQFLSKHNHAALQHHCWTQRTNRNINGSSKWDKDDREAAQVWKCVLYNLSDKANAVRSCLNNLSYLQPPILWLAAWLLHTQSTDQQQLYVSTHTHPHTPTCPHTDTPLM